MINSSFNGMTDSMVKNFLKEQGYSTFRKLADGEWIILMPLAYTLSVCCGPDLTSPFKYRWCFKDSSEAIYFFDNCQEFDEIPVKRESLKGHRYARQPLLVEYDELGFPKW